MWALQQFHSPSMSREGESTIRFRHPMQ
jgi:hypothetical protein